MNLTNLIYFMGSYGEFFSALIGAIVGGFFVILGSLLAFYWDRQKYYQDRHELLESLLIGISTELKTLLSQYKNTMGKDLEQLSPNASLDLYYSISEDYLVIFHSNAIKLGHLKDKNLLKSIITTYMKIKSFLDSFRLNNQMLSEYERLKSTNQSTDNNKQNRNKFCAKLKDQGAELSIEIPILIEQIKVALNKKIF